VQSALDNFVIKLEITQ